MMLLKCFKHTKGREILVTISSLAFFCIVEFVNIQQKSIDGEVVQSLRLLSLNEKCLKCIFEVVL